MLRPQFSTASDLVRQVLEYELLEEYKPLGYH